MRVKVQAYIDHWGEKEYGIYIKRWWFPFWVRIDHWHKEENALHHAILIKHPQPIEID